VLVESVLSCFAALRAFFQTPGDTALEILALRQQLAVLKRQHPRPQLDRLDRIFFGLPSAPVPDPVVEGGVTYTHFNVVVNPETPSKNARNPGNRANALERVP
jgi:hypothetical protein